MVSVVIPAYQSAQTLAECLRCLRAQTYPAMEIILVDSDPDPEKHRFVRAEFPEVRYIYSPARLLPHAARNRGVALAAGSLLLFTDPDVYAPPGWIAALVEVYRERAGVVVSALVCYGSGWFENGTHLSKFDKWLPGGPARPIDIGPTTGLLCDRSSFHQVGGFEGNYMLADTLIAWAFAGAGIPLWFQPSAIAAHHHLSNRRSLLQERYQRGREFGQLRLKHWRWNTLQTLRHAIISLIIPLRLAGLLWRGFRNAARAGLARSYFWHSPVVVSAQAAWLAGETAAYFTALAGRDSP